MLPEEHAFPQFASGVLQGLYRAVLTDPDVFLLLVAGVLGGGRSTRLRSLGASLALYVAFRRADRYVDVAVRVAALNHTTQKD